MPHRGKNLPRLSFMFVIWVLIAILVISIPLPVFSQDTFIPDVVQQASAACASVGRNEACYGNPGLTVTFQDDASSVNFKTPGATASLTNLEMLTTAGVESADETWGIAFLRPSAGLPDADSTAMNLVLMGDSTLTNAVTGADATVCTGKNLNNSPLNIFTAPGLNTPLLGVLAPLEAMTINGQDATQEWFRVVVSGKLGWVAESEVAIDCEANKLTISDESDLSPLYIQPMQAFTLQNANGSNASDAPNGLLFQAPPGEVGRLLVNGVQIDVSGAGFVSAEEEVLNVTGLQGRITLTGFGTSVTVLPGFSASVPLAAFLADGEPTEPQADKPVSLTGLLNSLIFGQPYDGSGETFNGLAFAASGALTENRLSRFDLSFTGDAASCPVQTEKPLLDVVFALDTSDVMAGATLDTVSAAVSNFIQHLDPGTDLVGTIAFNGQATALSALSADFTSAINSLRDLKTQNARAIDIGLGAAFSQLKAGRSGSAAQVIILITGGNSDVTLAENVANEIKNSGVRLITVGVGSDANPELLQGIANSESDALFVQNPVQLRDVLETVRLSLTKDIAARDLTITYQVDQDQFESVNDLMSFSGGKAERNTVEWRVPVVWDTQTLNFPIIVRPTSAGEGPVGTATVSYLACSEGNERIESGTIAAPLVNISTSGDAGEFVSGVLAAGESATGGLRAFEQQVWALDVASGQTISVTTETTDAALNAVLVGGTGTAIQPLYTLENIENSQRDQSVFFVPEGEASLLFLQSNNASAAGTYTVSIEAGAVEAADASLVSDSSSVEDEQRQEEGRIYDVSGNAGDTLTFRYTANGAAPGESPFTVFSLDGQAADVLVNQFDVNTNQWASLVMLKGAGPYQTLVRSTGQYSVAVEAGDTLTNARGPITVGETRDTDAKTSNAAIFSYTLNVPLAQQISVILGGSATQSVVRDANNRVVSLADRLAVNDFKVDFYNLEAGDYTLYLPAEGAFRISVAEGDVSQSLKGTLRPGQTRQGSLARNESLAVYSIVEGTGKPLVEGDLVTVTVDAVEVDPNNVFVESADGVRSLLTVEPITDVVDRSTKRLVSVHQLQGQGPYRIIVNGLQSYILRLDNGDLLNSDKGSLVIGQTVRDSSRAPQYLTYTLSPELGKGLVEGDILTISFLNQANSDKPFFSPFLEDGKQNRIGTQVDYVNARQFVGVYELVGTAPYRLIIPNIGSYVLSVNIGNRLELEQGKIVVGEPARATTTLPQIVHYTLEAEADQVLSVKLSLTGRGSFSPVTLTDVDGETLAPKRELYDGTYTRVYVLSGSGPYTLTFEMQGAYELSIEEGDKLTLDKGSFFIGDAETDEVLAEQGIQIVTYSLDIQAGQTITVQLNSDRNFYQFTLRTPDGSVVTPVWDWYFRDSQRLTNRKSVYTLRDAGTYELSYLMARKYTIRVTDGDQITLAKGNVFFDVQETDQLPVDQRFSTYTIHSEEGQTLSVEYTPGRNGSLIDSSLVNADGSLLYPVTSITDDEYIMFLYELEGNGPYTLNMQPSGPYQLLFSQRDLLHLDRGVLPYGQEIVDSPVPADAARNAPKPPKRMIYTIEGQAGDEVTLLLDIENVVYFDGLLYNDKLTRLTTGFDSRTRLYALSYRLTGDGPYSVYFDTTDEYTISLFPGDILTAPSALLPYGEEVEGRLESPVVRATYTVDGEPGDIISLQLEGTSEPIFSAAGNQFIPLLDLGGTNRASVYVYRLEGEAPYTLNFSASSRYNVLLSQGNVLIASQGELPINSANDLANPDFDPVIVSGRLTAPARFADYSFAGQAGDVVTLRLEARSSLLAPVLTDSAGGFINPQTTLFERDTILAVYQLAGDGPYRLVFDAPNQYEVELDAGDTLHYDAGIIPTGIFEEPYENELPDTARIAVHQLDVAPGQLMTLQIENGRTQVPLQVQDGNGKLLEPEFVDFQGGDNNVFVYILSGSAPYTAVFPASGTYVASVATVNLIRVDKGIVPFDSLVEDELAQPGRVVTYLVDGKLDQILSIQLQSGNRPVDGEFRDANGRLWLPEQQVTVNNALFNVYRLGGPGPYDITFSSTGKYAITVLDGNVLRAELGSVPLGEKVTNTLTAPAQIAVYNVDASPGEVVSVALQVSGRSTPSDLYNAEGQLLQALGTIERNNTAYTVYSLTGTAPYRLEFLAPRQYNLTVSQGNILRAELGAVVLNERVTETLDAPALIGVYTIDAQAGEFLSVQMQVGGRPAASLLFDADGVVLEPDAKLDNLNSTFTVYTLSGSEPYRLEFIADRQYNLTVSNGNVLRADQGVIRFGNTATTTLQQPAEAAIYTIDGQPGQVISLTLQDQGRPTNSELRDADGNLIIPWGQVRTTSASFSVYTLTGTAPYKVTFLPNGRYSLTLQEGNFFRAELGVIPFGQRVSNRLPVPAQTAVYTINTEADQVISAQIVNRAGREFIEARLVNADGDVIEPQTEVFDGTNISTSVYVLTGPAPYTFEFNVTGNYDLTFSRGDVTDPNFDPVGPQAVPQSPQSR